MRCYGCSELFPLLCGSYHETSVRRMMSLDAIYAGHGQVGTQVLAPSSSRGIIIRFSWRPGELALALAAGNCVIFQTYRNDPAFRDPSFGIMEKIGFPERSREPRARRGGNGGCAPFRASRRGQNRVHGRDGYGRAITKAASVNIKKLSPELGGKIPVHRVRGQRHRHGRGTGRCSRSSAIRAKCSAGSRLLLQESIYDKFLERLVARVKKIVVGPGIDPATEMGPLISRNS